MRYGGRLVEAASWNVTGGGPDRESWVYEVTLPAPGQGSVSQRLAASEVAHPRWAWDPASPWKGVSPLHGAGLTTEALAALEHGIALEADQIPSSIVSYPIEATNPTGVSRLFSSIVEAVSDAYKRGGVSAMALPTAFDGSRGSGPNVLRVGANIPEGHSELRRNLEATLASACRVPPELLSEPATGVSRREATRSFIATVRPVANMVASELSRLGVAINLALPVDADLAGRSRAVVQLVAAGVQLADAPYQPCASMHSSAVKPSHKGS